MKKIETLFKAIESDGYNFFTGVPDSALKIFQNDIISSNYENIIATNEGQSIGIAFGAELAGKKSCVYLQNSGLGNIINPLTSLCMPFNITPLLNGCKKLKIIKNEIVKYKKISL